MVANPATSQNTMNRQIQISQETYDQTVDENIEEFGMERSEAVKEAILQLNAQGIYKSKAAVPLSFTNPTIFLTWWFDLVFDLI